jgi:hypothetical protein
MAADRGQPVTHVSRETQTALLAWPELQLLLLPK